jgi:sigma-B regulation protein RsbU (phosphoserine phosphatase)
VSDAAGSGAGYEALFDNAPCGLLVTSEDGTIRLVNRTFCDWVGHDRAALVDRRKLQELLTMGGRIFHQTHWAPLLRIQGTIAEVKLDLMHRDGHAIPMIMNAARRQGDGAVRHEVAVFVAEDRHRYEREFIDARKRAEELLRKEREAQQALAAAQVELDRQHAAAVDRAAFAEQMVGIVSHDLRNPLMTVQMSAAVLARGELTPRQHRSVEAITNAVSRSKRLIDDLLDFTQARIGGGLSVAPTELDLHAFVAQSVADLGPLFAGRRLVHVARGSGRCMADEDRLAQLLGNLVTNAMTYGDPAGTVEVTSSVGALEFVLAVHNDGAPIPPEALPTLFDAMTRGERRGSGHSVGLGLFIVREIARAHGGRVAATSSAAEGTTFAATLPRGVQENAPA